MTALTKIDPNTVSMFSNIAQSLALAGFFPIGGQYQAKTREEQAAQAFVKILAGHELGIGPVLSMQHIHIIDGKTSLDATMVAGLIKSSGKYDYRVERLDNKGAALTFWELRDGEWVKIGDVTWGEADAKQAGLLGRGNWGKYPRDMFFSRAITFGARRYCPDVFLGPIYSPEELGADIPPSSTAEQVPAPALAESGDGATHHAEPVAQLTAHTEPEKFVDYDALLNKFATQLQKATTEDDESWAKRLAAARTYADTLQNEEARAEAHTIASGIDEARQLAREDAEERAYMEAAQAAIDEENIVNSN